MKHKIVNNFLEKDIFENIKNIVTSSNFPWFYNSRINTSYETNDNNTAYFTHTLFKDEKINSQHFGLFEPIFKKIKYKKLLKIKLNCYIRTEKLEIHKPHKDFIFKHKGFILYFNTCDGYTVLENNEKIESIENRGLYFDSSKTHSSTNCTNSGARFNININYL